MNRGMNEEHGVFESIEKTTIREYESDGKTYRESHTETTKNVRSGCDFVMQKNHQTIEKEQRFPDDSPEWLGSSSTNYVRPNNKKDSFKLIIDFDFLFISAALVLSIITIFTYVWKHVS